MSQYFKDLGAELVTLLENEFKKLYDDSDVIKIESKIKNIRFLGELTKFGVCPTKIALECLKKCLDEFNTHDIELTIHLLDTCGRYLSRGEAEAVLKFNNLLEIISRLKESNNSFH